MLRGLQKRRTILKAVTRQPGMGFIDIMKSTGYANGVVSHHLDVLEKEGAIRISRSKRKIWVFDSQLDSSDDNIRIALRKETCKEILVFLLENDIATFVQIRNAIKKSPGTTSFTLKKLDELGVLKIIYGFPKKYALKDFEKTSEILDVMAVSHTDELKDRFADTFSYL
ncbi:MAG: ArsR family transcriptional regulator [Nitrosopumilus sp.]|nr:ArsR family transcriptional regulator [Nitrosopumilus sp.]